MRILSSAVILAVGLTIGCGGRDETAQTTEGTDDVQVGAGTEPGVGAPTEPGVGAPPSAPATGTVTIEQHEAAMKQIAQSNGALQKLVKANELTPAVTEAQTLATQFELVERFWTQHAKADAVELAQTGRQGALDTVAAAQAGDQMKAQMAAGNIGGTCKQCHGTYREGDAETGYRIAASAGITE